MSYEKPWTKPLASDFEVQNLPTDATIDDGVKALVFRDKLTSTNTNVMVYAGTAVPTGGASGWYAECRVAIANALQSYGTMGLVIRNSSTNRMAALCVGRDASTLLFNTWNSYTSWNGVISMCDQSTHDAWFRVEKSGTDIKFGYSIDGYNWLWCIFTNTTSGWVATPDEVGLGFNPNGWGSYSQTQGQFATALCASWKTGTI